MLRHAPRKRARPRGRNVALLPLAAPLRSLAGAFRALAPALLRTALGGRLLRYLRAALARFGKPDGDRLLSALHFLARPAALELAGLVFVHCPLDLALRRLAVLRHSSVSFPSRTFHGPFDRSRCLSGALSYCARTIGRMTRTAPDAAPIHPPENARSCDEHRCARPAGVPTFESAFRRHPFDAGTSTLHASSVAWASVCREARVETEHSGEFRGLQRDPSRLSLRSDWPHRGWNRDWIRARATRPRIIDPLRSCRARRR